MHFLAAFLSSFPLLAAAASTGGGEYASTFARVLSPGASIHFPGQTDYNTSTVQRYSLWEPPTFVVTIKPATEKDIQSIIKIADRLNIDYLATGGGHGSETGYATVKNAVNIDLSNFKQNELDVTANTLTVGPGIRFVDFQENLYNAGKFVPVGNLFCVNMIGATIGAGVGPYQGLHGLVLDALLSVRLITAKGDLITVSANENRDLWWAIRGAGANFGIITSAKYKVFEAPNNGLQVQADFVYPGSANASLYELLQSWDSTYPREMGLTLSAIFNRTTNQMDLSAAVSFFGPQEDAQPWLDGFIALEPTRWQNQTIPWFSLSSSSGFGTGGRACNKGVYNPHYSAGAKQTAPATLTEIVNAWAEFAAPRPWFNGNFFIQRFNVSATLAVPESERGVYPGREIAALNMLNMFSDGPQHDEETYAFAEPLRDKLAATSGFGELRTYINYAFGDEGPAKWYGEQNLPRLVGLKRKWDPKNKFGAGNPIPLSL